MKFTELAYVLRFWMEDRIRPKKSQVIRNGLSKGDRRELGPSGGGCSEWSTVFQKCFQVDGVHQMHGRYSSKSDTTLTGSSARPLFRWCY